MAAKISFTFFHHKPKQLQVLMFNKTGIQELNLWMQKDQIILQSFRSTFVPICALHAGLWIWIRMHLHLRKKQEKFQENWS